MQHPLEGSLSIESEELAHAEGDGHAFDDDRLGVLLPRQSHDFLLFPQVRGWRRRTFEDPFRSRDVDEDRQLSRRLHDDSESVRAERRADETTRAGLSAAPVDVNPDRNRLEAIRVVLPFTVPAKPDDGPDGGETRDERSPSPEHDESAPGRR